MSNFQQNKKLNLLPLPYIGLFDLDLIYQMSDVELLYNILAKVNEIAKSQGIIINDFNLLLEYIEQNINTLVTDILNKALQDGSIFLNTDYDESSKTLKFIFRKVAE